MWPCVCISRVEPPSDAQFRPTTLGEQPLARLLIVDDEPDIRFMMRIILERAGYQVAEASNGAAAIEAISLSRPDLVLTDLMMPVMNGDRLIRALRADPETASIPILMVSAVRNQTVADAGLDKPFEPRRLVEAVSKLLQGKPQT